VADVVRRPSGYGERVAPGSVDLVLVLEARGWEVSDGAGLHAGHLREWVGRRRTHVQVRRGIAPDRPVGVLGLLGASLGAGVGFRLGGLDVAFALELGDELLDDVDFEVVEDVWRVLVDSWLVEDGKRTDDGLLRNKHPTELLRKVTSILLAVIYSDAHGETTRLHNISNAALEAVDVLVTDGQAPDLDLAAHAIDADDKLHGRLLMRVHEAQGSKARVPLWREPRGEGLAFS
jgi:hypothetical protein